MLLNLPRCRAKLDCQRGAKQWEREDTVPVLGALGAAVLLYSSCPYKCYPEDQPALGPLPSQLKTAKCLPPFPNSSFGEELCSSTSSLGKKVTWEGNT